jgi:predicted ATPase/DNA-binding SARP family transcriptional activator
MEIRLLGPVELRLDGGDSALGAPKLRSVLAMLALRANEPVSTDALIDGLWGERPPAAAAKAVQVYVSRLRKLLAAADAEIVTRGSAYELRIPAERVDALRFERLIDAAAGDRDAADGAAREALSLWRGAPLQDLTDEPFAAAEIRRLEELWMRARELAIDEALGQGRHAEVVAELQALVAEHPLRERLHAQLMLALYRCDRQADALQAYRDVRTVLVEQLGLEPGERLRELEAAILAHDPELAAPAAGARSQCAAERRLPPPPTRTFGREADRSAVVELLRGDARLVTLTGPGGVGKTRLALEVARELESELPDGAWLVLLAATARPEHVPAAVAQVLAISQVRGGTPEAVRRFLAPMSGLLVLDNFEHVIGAARFVADLMAACPDLRVLATSREPLRIQAEHRYAVEPLPVPAEDQPDVVAGSPAGALFAERARSHEAGFEVDAANAAAIAAVCRRLDGLPLAIELAAARTPLLGVHELSARLGEALDLLTGGPRDAPERHRALRATIEWSDRLLGSDEAEAFARLAVFAGGSTVEAAEEVTGASLDTLAGLVDKHLLIRRLAPGGQPRLAMFETVREYALERLEDRDDAREIHARHCRHYRELAERAEPELFAEGETEWMPRLDAEIDNLRAAHDWSVANDPVEALRLIPALSTFWVLRDGLPEAIERADAALAAAGEEAPAHERARAHVELAIAMGNRLLFDSEEWANSRDAHAAEALALFRGLDDQAGIGWALIVLAWPEQAASLPQRKRLELADEALRCGRAAGDSRLIGLALVERALALPQTKQGPTSDLPRPHCARSGTCGASSTSTRARCTTRSRWATRLGAARRSPRRYRWPTLWPTRSRSESPMPRRASTPSSPATSSVQSARSPSSSSCATTTGSSRGVPWARGHGRCGRLTGSGRARGAAARRSGGARTARRPRCGGATPRALLQTSAGASRGTGLGGGAAGRRGPGLRRGDRARDWPLARLADRTRPRRLEVRLVQQDACRALLLSREAVA